MEEYSDIINDMNFWPADDLALGLVDLYFNTCNLVRTFVPLSSALENFSLTPVTRCSL